MSKKNKELSFNILLFFEKNDSHKWNIWYFIFFIHIRTREQTLCYISEQELTMGVVRICIYFLHGQCLHWEEPPERWGGLAAILNHGRLINQKSDPKTGSKTLRNFKEGWGALTARTVETLRDTWRLWTVSCSGAGDTGESGDTGERTRRRKETIPSVRTSSSLHSSTTKRAFFPHRRRDGFIPAAVCEWRVGAGELSEADGGVGGAAGVSCSLALVRGEAG